MASSGRKRGPAPGASVDLRSLFRRAFPGLVLGLLGLSASLIGRGVSALIETELLLGVGELTRPWPREPAEAPTARPTRSAAALLERNPFDSRTGSLFPSPAKPAEVQAPATSDPLAAPKCGEVDVYSTIVSADPLWSSAVIQGPGEARGHVRRVGDAVGARQLVFVGRNPSEQSPAVWLLEGVTLCQAVLFDGTPRRGAAPAKPAAPPKALAAPAAPPRVPAPLAPEIATKIRRVSATEFVVERSAVDRIMADYAALVRGSRIRPQKQDGALSGFRIDRIDQHTLLGRLGLQKGDQVQSINGFPLTSSDKALRAYASLRTASELRVRLVRGGKPMTIDYRIR